MNNQFNEDFNQEHEVIDTFEVAKNTYQAKKKGRRMNSFTKKVGVLVLSGAILGTAAGGAFAASTYLFPQNQTNISSSQMQSSGSSIQNTTLTSFNNTSVSSSDNASVQSIAENCMPSIVAITNIGVTETMTMWGNVQQESESCGSGIIIGETDSELLIVTNYHVIEGSKTLTVVFSYDENSENPEAVEAYVKGYDENKDLAVIGISKDNLNADVLSQISIAAVGNSQDLGLGEQVVAIGNALGYGQSVTTGIVSALNRQIATDESGESDGNEYIQTDAAINPGNSGGALFNMNGELVGINTAKIASSEIEGMGYAIPISDVYDLIEDFMNQTARTEVYSDEEKGYLGISGTDVTSSASSAYGMPEGVYVYDVTEGGAAANAGIEKGYIITKFDGKSVTSSSDLQTLLTYYKAGETVTVTVQVPDKSEYEEKEISVTLGKGDSSSSDSSSSSQTTPDDSYSNTMPFGYSNGNGYGNSYSNGNQFA